MNQLSLTPLFSRDILHAILPSRSLEKAKACSAVVQVYNPIFALFPPLLLLNSGHHNHCSQGCSQPQIPKWPFLVCKYDVSKAAPIIVCSVRRYHHDSNSSWASEHEAFSGCLKTLCTSLWPGSLLQTPTSPPLLVCPDPQALSLFITYSTAELHPSLLLPHMQRNSPFLLPFPKSLSPSIIILQLCVQSHHISVIPMRS